MQFRNSLTIFALSYKLINYTMRFKNNYKPAESFILVINPGSTSTKTALFCSDKQIVSHVETLQSSRSNSTGSLWEQFETRLLAVQRFIQNNKISRIDAVVGRGGLLKPVRRGIYKVNETMLQDARKGVQGEHPANLGCALAQQIAQEWRCPAFVVDPVSVDEFEPPARYSGHPLIERRTLSHALNLRAAAYWGADKQGISLQKSRFVISHLGGGISIAAVRGGRIIDVNDASSAGPFSPERSGSLPLQQFADLCFSGTYSRAKIKKMIMGEGGLVAYLGTSNLIEIEARIDGGDLKAKEVYEAMAYQVAKEIAAMASVLCGRVDAVVLTGGLANSHRFLGKIKKRISFIAPIIVFAGELEMEAMASGALRVLTGNERAKNYR